MARQTVTRNGKGGAMQLSLFADPPVGEEKQEENLPTSEEEMIIDPYGNKLPAVVFQWSAWADGDTSPSAIERLAEVMLLDTTIRYWGPLETLEEKHRWKIEYSHSIPGYERYRYRCVASGVVDGKAWGAYIYEMCLMDLSRQRDMEEKEDL